MTVCDGEADIAEDLSGKIARDARGFVRGGHRGRLPPPFLILRLNLAAVIGIH